MRKIYLLTVLVIVTLFLQSCAAYYFPQKVKVESPERNATVIINGYRAAVGYPNIIPKKSKLVVASVKSGYRTKSQFIRPNKFNFGVLVDFSLAFTMVGTEDFGLGLGVFGGIAAADYLIAGKRQARHIVMEPMEKLYTNDNSSIFIYPHENLDTLVYSETFYKHYGNAKKFEEMADAYANTSTYKMVLPLYEWMDGKLAMMEFQNPRAQIILPYNNTIKLDVEILETTRFSYKIGYHRVQSNFRFHLCDNFGNRLVSIDQVGTSQIFFTAMGAFEFEDCVKDALYDAMSTMMKGEEFKTGCANFQKLYDEKHQSQEAIALSKPLIANPSLEEMVDAQVSIDMNDDSHGSGCLISPEGHILASHRIVGKADTVDVVFSNGVKKRATVIRRDAVSNVVLLKTDTLGNAALMLDKNFDTQVGEEVLAVGSPVSMSLAQSLTSGIISSTHKMNDLDYFQTDVRISRGGNGSPLVDKKGRLIGLVNEKYIEPGVEGISFAISSADILRRLNLTYSN